MVFDEKPIPMIEKKKKKRMWEEETTRFKARLVIKGYLQKDRVDNKDVFSPVVRHTNKVITVLSSSTWHRDRIDGCKDHLSP